MSEGIYSTWHRKKLSTDGKHEVQTITLKLKLNRQKLKYTDQTMIVNKTSELNNVNKG